MKEETTTVYCCDYCSKVSKFKSAMISHEKNCKHNPDTARMCYKCVHYHTRDEKTIDVVYYESGFPLNKEYHKEMNPHICECDNRRIFNPTRMRDLKVALEEDGWKEMPTFVQGCSWFEKKRKKR